MPTTVLTVRLFFKDKSGNESSLHLYVPASLSTAQVITFLDYAYDRIQPLSNASLFQARIYYKHDFDETNEAEIGSDCRSFVALFYRNEEIYDAIYIPSPKPALFESEGEYSGIRVDPLAEAIVSLNTALSNLDWPLATEEGEAFPLEYVTGGRVL